MMELREKIAELIREGRSIESTDSDVAESILAIPEIAEALLLMATAQRRFGDAARQADPSTMMLGMYQNAHPWANLLKRDDMPSQASNPSPSSPSQ